MNSKGDYLEDKVESDLLIKLSNSYPKPLMLSSLLLLQFNSITACYDTLIAIGVDLNACTNNSLQFTLKDFRKKQTLLEAQERNPLDYQADKAITVTEIKRDN